MREVIAICMSEKKSRDRTAKVLDRYFWRIGDRTWRGKATNACLDRVSREIRKEATRNTAVTIYEIRSSHESRLPLVRIGSKTAFSDGGLVPVTSHPSQCVNRLHGTPAERSAGAIVRIAALFHDLGKATKLFQNKLKYCLETGKNVSDPVRHELHSAYVWDVLFGDLDDTALVARLRSFQPADIDQACSAVVPDLVLAHYESSSEMKLRFTQRADTIAFAVGMIILTHHRLPEGNSSHRRMIVRRHVNNDAPLGRDDLAIAAGVPFWHENWWMRRIRRDTEDLKAGSALCGIDLSMRASLMLSDHMGSSRKRESTGHEHLANTKDDLPADSLSQHVQRVYMHCRSAFDVFHRYSDRFPALSEGQMPVDILYPGDAPDRFKWQAEAASAARGLAEAKDGGFFGCILAGTGTGKTRGAPMILAGAAFGDTRPERRSFRMTLGLGLRVLATQSSKEYVDDLGFRDEDISVLVGQTPVLFAEQEKAQEDAAGQNGSESLIDIPEWLQVEQATGGIPKEGSPEETNWLRGLSMSTDRGLPAFCEMVIEGQGEKGPATRRLLVPPIMIGTIDHLMAVAAPLKSIFLIQAMRAVSSDLILDEIDQYGPEDLAALARLVYQTAVGGRRVIIMSATLSKDIAESFHAAYVAGWNAYAAMKGVSSHVNILCSGDTVGSCFSNSDSQSFGEVVTSCQASILKAIDNAPILRPSAILPPSNDWEDLINQVSDGCTKMHEAHSTSLLGFRVSVGLVRLTRISHTAALATQLPAGDLNGRLRVKVCLHSLFPRLHRAWIETCLKQALTRKGPDPDAGLLSLCHAQDLFQRASKIGARDIEVIVIASPVIETGNDLDFDYAILDPISIRSIIQSAGRVRRHRPASGEGANVLILGRSPIAMQSGSLSMPGVETRPHKDTNVVRISLNRFEGRLFSELAGNELFDKIDASVLLSDDKTVPLRDQEAVLRRAMIAVEGQSPLHAYLTDGRARMNLAMTRSRKFRRSTTSDVRYTMTGTSVGDAIWTVDLTPGTKESRQLFATQNGLEIADGEDPVGVLFRDLTLHAWQSHSGGLREMNSADLGRMLEVRIPIFPTDESDLFPSMVYSEFTGFTRGVPEDLFSAFGKSLR